MENKVYYVWLQNALGINSSVRTSEILAYFGDAKSLYFAGNYEWKISGVITPRQAEKLSKKDLEPAVGIVEECTANGWNIITSEDENYPPLLLNLFNYPLVLYVNGDLSCLKNRVPVAVVGTRKPTEKSVMITSALCADMAKSGAVIISGGALGIDSAAHTGALSASGKTVCVLGCGFASNYLEANRALRNDISKHGAVVTEYPPQTAALGKNFPIRNRIISGLSYGTVVIEGGEHSGSLITARCALEQGRDVFAVPGDITASGFTGTNRLIHDGAKPVFSAADVLEEYAMLYPELIDIEKVSTRLEIGQSEYKPAATAVKPAAVKPAAEKKPALKKADPGELKLLSEAAVRIYSAFGEDVLQAEDVIIRTGLDARSFSSAMTELELFGFIEQLPGKKYRLINR